MYKIDIKGVGGWEVWRGVLGPVAGEELIGVSEGRCKGGGCAGRAPEGVRRGAATCCLSE